MKYLICFTVLLLFSFGCSKQNYIGIENCHYSHPYTNEMSQKQEAYQIFLNNHLTKGYPGLSLAVYEDTQGFWVGTAGYASIEAQKKMEKCHLHFSASICKMYLAVVVLKLYEEGKIDLNEKAIHYLPKDIPKVANLELVTVKQLLNHQSGIVDFDSQPILYVQTINNPYIDQSSYDYLNKYVKGRPATMPPGEDFSYSDTNYILLGFIIEKVTQQPLGQVVQNKIFTPIGLSETYYKHSENYPNVSGVTQNYAAVYNRSIENCTTMHHHFANIAMGHTGLIASPRDYVLFLSKLLNGEILNDDTLQLMLDFGDKPYGLGIQKFETPYGVILGHSGGGYGTMTYLLHVVNKNTTYFYASNLGSIFESSMSIHFDTDMFDDILEIIHK